MLSIDRRITATGNRLEYHGISSSPSLPCWLLGIGARTYLFLFFFGRSTAEPIFSWICGIKYRRILDVDKLHRVFSNISRCICSALNWHTIVTVGFNRCKIPLTNFNDNSGMTNTTGERIASACKSRARSRIFINPCFPTQCSSNTHAVISIIHLCTLIQVQIFIAIDTAQAICRFPPYFPYKYCAPIWIGLAGVWISGWE